MREQLFTAGVGSHTQPEGTQMTKRNTVTLVAIAVLATLLAACGGLSTKQTVASQLEEARALNTELRGEWTAAQELMNSTQTAVEQFPTIGIDPATLDMALLKKAMTECFEAPLANAEDAAVSEEIATGEEATAMAEETGEAVMVACEGESMAALTEMKGKAAPEVMEFIDNKVGAVSMIKTNIKEALPTTAINIAERFVAAKLKVEELRLTADGYKTLADANPLMNDQEKAAFNDDYEALQTEIGAIEEMLGSMESEALGMPDRVRGMGEAFMQGMANFGQAAEN
jgi:hypothetical protein